MTRPLTLCADDFGAAPGISAAIVELAEAGRLAAVSCLVTGAHWPGGVAAVPGLATKVDVGLHFNLSDGRPLSAELARVWPRLPALPNLIVAAHLGRLPLDALRAEFAAQLDAFRAAALAVPRFVDGHQHVHHLPGVRGIVLDAIAALRPRPAVRNTGRVLGPGFAIKRALIAGTGGRALQRELERRGIAHNAALTGVYDFAATRYRLRMRRWLARVPAEGALLFCHPGAPSDPAVDDPIAAARAHELAYLRSREFDADLASAGVVLGPVWRTAS